MTAPLHATVVARRGPEGWRALMITGPSGAGKSDLALRLIASGWTLVSDDYSLIWASGGALYARAPDTIAGRIEVRGVGVVHLPRRETARVVLALDCVDGPVERLPEPGALEIGGVAIPRLDIDPRLPSAAALAAAAMQGL
ncbi:serine kinase [Brevundimonas sp. S30B]|uniref:HPr kinase/phosphorylase n=1 Tax=unclassified Brevundimonas TaxID=2622653 RepID=UPI00107274E4|nr:MULTISPECIES: serine kinase [unclassified Brevundimonas]QBX36823.1 serine kinase [Brevundimonas sp. MF30-B]TFW04382.1 serine kinase [Brevundimonas sp. S30B]